MNEADIVLATEAEIAHALITAVEVRVSEGFVFVKGRDGKIYITDNKLESCDE